MSRPVLAAVLVLFLGTGLAACAPDPVAPEARPAEVAARSPVTDPETGVSAELPGAVQRDTETVLDADQEVQGRVYRARDDSGRVEAVLHLSPLAAPERLDPATAAERTAHFVLGELVYTRPVTADGHDALDARIEGWPHADGSGTLLLRIVGTPQFEVTVEANGATADAAHVQQVFDEVCASLRIP